jgi:hypothetical protein
VPGQTAPLVNVRHELKLGSPASQSASSQSAAPPSAIISPEIFNAGLQSLHLLRNDLLFTGRMLVPPTPQGQRRRLIVREYERHFGDFNITDSTPIGQVTRPGVAERLVFAREFYVLGYVPTEQVNGEKRAQ